MFVKKSPNMKTSIFTISLLLLLIGLGPELQAQAVQTVKGTVTDRQSELPLVGVAVEVLLENAARGTVTDLDGQFVFTDVPVGRQALRFSYLGYETVTIPNILVTAGKESVLQISMEESVLEMNEVVVTATVEKDKAQNELATISARSFNLEEVTRYSGGRNDVARLAGNFAGVAVADDSRNDIVIRGNSPTGVLWRLEGIPIPNPNHFSTLGTTGGPVSALNPNLLSNSDFLTSAFPAEYGDALAGVFDIGFRSGNKDKYEFMFQLAAFSGLEAMVEGPLSPKNNSSFLLSYRHSFVQIADQLGIPIGTNATPDYRDLSFKVDLGNSKAGKFSFFGIAGNSKIDFLGSDTDSEDLFADPNEDSYPRSRLAIVGMRHNILAGKDGYIRTVASFSTSQNDYTQDNYLPDGEKLRTVNVKDVTDTYSLSSFWNKKFNARFTLRTGILLQNFQINTRVDDRENTPDFDSDGIPDWIRVRDFDGGMSLLQAYTQSQYRLGRKWTINAGLHAQYLDINDKYAIEPRLAFNWQFHQRQRLSLGYGLHHQMQPFPLFFYEEEITPGVYERSNADLDFLQSHHFVLGYDLKLGTDWRVKTEAYYQSIQNAAVESAPSSFSLLNAGADFIFPQVGSLVNDGTGTNYGLELTVEKFFNRGYYGLLTASVFDATYTGSDGIERNSAFNNGYVINFLTGKEVKIGKEKRNALTFDTKFTTAGGRYYTPVDLEASIAAGEEILLEDEAFSLRYDPYLRLDVKIGYQLNSKTKKISQQFFLDLQNITNNQNIFVKRYNSVTNEVNDVYQSGFFPDLLYRLQF